MAYVIQERYRDGEWSDTLPVLATQAQAEMYLDDVEAMAAPGYSYRIAPASPYVADPANPTDAEISAAIERGLANGSLIDAGEWMARHAAELGR